MKKVLVFIIIFQNFCFLKAQNTDYLEPCSSVFSDFQTESEYFISIHKILFNGLSNFPSARTLICPSFEPEYLISIEREEFESNYQRVFSREFYLKYRTCKPGIRAR